ncbi:xylan O-acetyltransferase 3-like [Rosa rugosa]|uniref:xylan O-acetyltransferase 3-like n=1 Tax=Rosa rugosa TaxID=74645 RepID=UPI002B40908F|nr:xylan O-acetyltransferase 3-like [Rosa rugosa]
MNGFIHEGGFWLYVVNIFEKGLSMLGFSRTSLLRSPISVLDGVVASLVTASALVFYARGIRAIVWEVLSIRFWYCMYAIAAICLQRNMFRSMDPLVSLQEESSVLKERVQELLLKIGIISSIAQPSGEAKERRIPANGEGIQLGGESKGNAHWCGYPDRIDGDQIYAISSYVQQVLFQEFIKNNCICFAFSMSVILLLLCGFLFYKRAIVWIYTMLMCLTLFFWSITFYKAIRLVDWSSAVARTSVSGIRFEFRKEILPKARVPPRKIFTIKEFDASIEYYWAPFIVESISDHATKHTVLKRLVKLDSIAKHGKHWEGVDILVFESYVWWMHKPTINATYGSPNDVQEYNVTTAYKLALLTWAEWLESRINPERQKVFFISMSPTHLWSWEWRPDSDENCYNESHPIQGSYWGTGSNTKIMDIIDYTLQDLKVKVTFLNITQLSEYRKDAHTSVYGERKGKLLTKEQKSDPKNFADCIHWCLPEVPDTWNEILYAHLLKSHQNFL